MDIHINSHFHSKLAYGLQSINKVIALASTDGCFMMKG
jgi:hypothetical protein